MAGRYLRQMGPGNCLAYTTVFLVSGNRIAYLAPSACNSSLCPTLSKSKIITTLFTVKFPTYLSYILSVFSSSTPMYIPGT